jgi:hypothetical protein
MPCQENMQNFQLIVGHLQQQLPMDYGDGVVYKLWAETTPSPSNASKNLAKHEAARVNYFSQASISWLQPQTSAEFRVCTVTPCRTLTPSLLVLCLSRKKNGPLVRLVAQNRRTLFVKASTHYRTAVQNHCIYHLMLRHQPNETAGYQQSHSFISCNIQCVVQQVIILPLWEKG